MASIKFYLKKPRINGVLRDSEVSISAKFSIGRDHRFEITTGEKIIPKHWNSKKQEVKSSYRGHYEINIALSDFKTKLLMLYREHKELPFDKFKDLVISS